MNLFISLAMQCMKAIPDNLISYVVGMLSRIELPGFLQSPLNKLFVKLFSVDMQEAEYALSDYKSIEQVFTRRLKPEARVLEDSHQNVLMPCDGTLSISKGIGSDGQMIQAKGLDYGVNELLFGNRLSPANFNPGYFSTIYLAPHNYHRVHTPISGKLIGIHYIPGALIPVNQPFVKFFPKLFCKNERMVFQIEDKDGLSIFVVMVGALNVGRIQTIFWPELVSNSFKRQWDGTIDEQHLCCNFEIKAGDELGTFMLGSTAVVVFDKKIAEKFNLNHTMSPVQVRLGQSLGKLKEPAE